MVHSDTWRPATGPSQGDTLILGLEARIEPSPGPNADVRVRTSVDGYAQVWKEVLDRFFSRFDHAAHVEINDFGATPGTVTLRLEQAAEEARS